MRGCYARVYRMKLSVTRATRASLSPKPEISVLLNTRSAMVVDLETQDMETTMHDLIVAGAYLVLAIHYFVMVISH